MTNLRPIPATQATPDSAREVIAWAIDDWLERTAPTEGAATTWSSADIAEHVTHRLEQSGYQLAAPAGLESP